MDEAAVRALLRRQCEKAGSQAAWAKTHGVSAPYVNDVLQGSRSPGQSILNALGLERITAYRKKRAESNG